MELMPTRHRLIAALIFCAPLMMARAAEPAAALDLATLTDAHPEWREGLAAFLAAAPPRAIAFAPDGHWGLGTGSPRAIDRAVQACKSGGSGACRVVAVDEQLVPDPGRAFVAVQMGGYADDAFSAEVAKQWLPVVRSATSQFDHLVNEVLQVQLGRDVHVYIGAGVEDYEQVLAGDMHMRAERANLEGEVSGGLSNSRGQIALKFTPKLKPAALYERAVKTPLHELTHELQKQLGANYAGFRPPIWMIEGTADLMAFTLARDLQVSDVEARPLRDWRERNLTWWRRGNTTGLQADDLVGVTHARWLQMMKEKRGCYQMAGLMSMYLQSLGGEHFLQSWVAYFRSAGVRGQDADAAFMQAFGMSEVAFVADFKRWLAQQ